MPKNLRQSIITGIAREEKRLAKIYLIKSLTFFCASFTGVILSFRYLLAGLEQSGFYHYLSIIFSGDSVIFAYWKELSYSIAETVPVIGTVVFLTTLGFFIWSGIKTVVTTRRFILLAN